MKGLFYSELESDKIKKYILVSILVRTNQSVTPYSTILFDSIGLSTF